MAYGTNIAECRKLLVEAIKELHITDPKKEPKITVKSFEDSSVNLKIFVWLPVISQATDTGRVLETVYETLTENNIQIPFPQRDIHLISN